MNRAVLFYKEKDFLKGCSCFDVRFDCQFIPKGAVVIGFLAKDRELIDTVFCTPEQEENLKTALAFARAVLQNDPIWVNIRSKLSRQLYRPGSLARGKCAGGAGRN